MARNQKLMADLELDLQTERARLEQKVEKEEKSVADAEIQTDEPVEIPPPIVEAPIEEIVAETQEKSTKEPEKDKKSSKHKKSFKSGKNSKSMEVETPVIAAVLESPQAISKITTEPHPADHLEDSSDDLMNHPKVLYEDELIVFKEQCATLQQENVRLSREMAELSGSLGQERQRALQHFIIKYLMPVVVLFFAYVFYWAR